MIGALWNAQTGCITGAFRLTGKRSRQRITVDLGFTVFPDADSVSAAADFATGSACAFAVTAARGPNRFAQVFEHAQIRRQFGRSGTDSAKSGGSEGGSAKSTGGFASGPAPLLLLQPMPSSTNRVTRVECSVGKCHGSAAFCAIVHLVSARIQTESTGKPIALRGAMCCLAGSGDMTGRRLKKSRGASRCVQDGGNRVSFVCGDTLVWGGNPAPQFDIPERRRRPGTAYGSVRCDG